MNFPKVFVQFALWEAKIGHEDSWFFLATMASSVCEAAYGLTKLLKVGPCRLLPKNACICGFGLAMTFFSILTVLALKGMIMLLGIAFGLYSRATQIALWSGLCVLPQSVMVILH